MIDETINLLGRRATDKVTGYAGVVSSVCFDLYGCVQVALTPPAPKEGKLEHGNWFDVHRLTLNGDEHVMPVPDFRAAAIKPADFKHGAAEKPAPQG